MIRLHQYPPAFGLSSLSPFCIKVEAYLRMAGIPFESVPEVNPWKGPRGRMPYIEARGEKIHDSDQILEYLEARSGPFAGACFARRATAVSWSFRAIGSTI